MEFFSVLWLPILLSAVGVFVLSSLIHVVLPVHKDDYRKFPDEDAAMTSLREQGLTPGLYAMPMPASMKDMGSPEMKTRYEAGPVAFVTVLPSRVPNMGRELVSWFLYSCLVGIFTGYVAWVGVGPGGAYREVFRLTSTMAVFAYGLAYLPDSIWKAIPFRVTAKFVVSGVIYGLLTAGIFGWLWPGPA